MHNYLITFPFHENLDGMIRTKNVFICQAIRLAIGAKCEMVSGPPGVKWATAHMIVGNRATYENKAVETLEKTVLVPES